MGTWAAHVQANTPKKKKKEEKKVPFIQKRMLQILVFKMPVRGIMIT